MAGGSLSTTVTRSGQVAVFPAASVAVVRTVVVPTEKIEPEAGVETMVTGDEQVSAASVVNDTGAPHAPGAAGTVIGAGHVTWGGVISTTITRALAWLIAPFVSFTVRSTSVEPMSYGPGGACVISSASPSASDDPSSIEAAAPHTFADAATVTSLALAPRTW